MYSSGHASRLEGKWGRLFWGLVAALVLLVALAGCAAKAPTATPVPAKVTGYANPDLLVETEWLAQHLGDAKLRIVDARTPDNYEAGHIKGAVNIPVGETFNPTGPKQMVGPKEQIEALFGSKGIDKDTRVVVYAEGKDTTASRILWTLEYFGHTKVAVLNGGYTKWTKENREVETGKGPTVAPAKFTAIADASRLSTKQQILDILGKPGVALVDARSPEEYRGDDLRTKRGGRIPGAVNLDWRTLFTGGDVPVLKSAEELTQMYERLGVTKDKEVYAYCQTGQRSSVTYLSLRLLGYDRVRNYDGSWQEWGNDPDTPIEK